MNGICTTSLGEPKLIATLPVSHVNKLQIRLHASLQARIQDPWDEYAPIGQSVVVVHLHARSCMRCIDAANSWLEERAQHLLRLAVTIPRLTVTMLWRAVSIPSHQSLILNNPPVWQRKIFLGFAFLTHGKIKIWPHASGPRRFPIFLSQI